VLALGRPSRVAGTLPGCGHRRLDPALAALRPAVLGSVLTAAQGEARPAAPSWSWLRQPCFCLRQSGGLSSAPLLQRVPAAAGGAGAAPL